MVVSDCDSVPDDGMLTGARASSVAILTSLIHIQNHIQLKRLTHCGLARSYGVIKLVITGSVKT